ncbi:hypothetical protein QNI16_22510 [Cytophagaceae bacterium YF14B1]|uniref:Uncharacterized protein n=1 Tax=Xanthocytophaga flava TaxID=3048013 RepID=A0AAE3UAG7_9BACT|nr:hypothetical protein [Xanthocytophaga flavus]MDJ1483288.1 hypothetical protein [Xanthocytophaga flavus]
MKTSNKLLLGFVGVLFAGMLTCNFILKAEYERIKNEKIVSKEYRTLSKDSFKYIKVDGTNQLFTTTDDDSEVLVEYATTYEITSLQDISSFAKIRFIGDTLLVNFEAIPDSLRTYDNQRLIIRCPSVSFIELKNVNKGYLSDFKLSDLTIHLKGTSYLGVLNNRIDKMILQEYNDSSCEINMTNGAEFKKDTAKKYINHLKLTLKDRSSFNADDIPFTTIDPIVDDSANISLSGASLRPLLKRSVQQ